ncbi:N-acetylneuraminate synthase family protein [Neosynechococcus sphagnicola]|uniref:N-acetylneuraminate synthase family protein n=1 Tax=Neosynechococcus sphagnicola TaxID=1501145 RepID=UPI0006897CD0|nr:N-acetylneuraminate synthase family protein [Neosynechococcus sphagnicola]
MNRKTIVIAEIGENHIGNWQLVPSMIQAAAAAGADIVKFQSYFGADVAADDPEREWFTQVQLSNDRHFQFKALAEAAGIEFLSTPFSIERAQFLVEVLGLRKIKIASSEMLNWGLLDYLNGRVETLFLSTGLATLAEIQQAVAHLDRIPHLYILQCTTQYPCPEEEANLAVISTLKASFPQHHVGYSDHTLGLLAPVLAVALGAEVIEKHLTLDKSLPGTDHILSVTPTELAQLVAQIRSTETLLGGAEKQPTANEAQIRAFVRNRFPKVPAPTTAV